MDLAPTITAFSRAVQSRAFSEPYLAEGRLARNRMGSPLSYAGNFAVVYRMTTDRGDLAVKCYWRELPEHRRRLRAINQRLRTISSPHLVAFEYLEKCLQIGSRSVAVAVMPWVSGTDLRTALDENRDTEYILRVRASLRRLVTTLTRARIAHGDLQHGNLLVLPDATVVAVDYDMMFVPAALGLGSAGMGHANYQHPGRGEAYDRRLDSTAALLLDLALSALALDPTLWDQFDVEDGILFSQADLAAPRRSPLVRSLLASTELGPRAERIIQCCEGEYDNQPLVTYSARQQDNVSRASDDLPIMAATDRDALLGLVGHRVRVVGKAVSLRFASGSRGRPQAFVHFGSRSSGGLVIRVLATKSDLSVPPDVLESAREAFVQVEGVISVFEREGRPSSPQIDVTAPDALTIIDERTSDSLLSPARTSGSHGSARRRSALDALYRARHSAGSLPSTPPPLGWIEPPEPGPAACSS